MRTISRTGAIIFVVLVLFLASSAASTKPENASEQKAISVANPFTWATTSPIDWDKGFLYAGLGLVGALVTVFSLVGGAVPGTSGFARIEAGLKRVEEREKIIDKLIRDKRRYPDVITAVEKATDNLRDDLRADRRQQFAIAATLYAILGAFFATALAQDLLQALLIGAGWTAYLGAMGLKRDYAERKSIKDKATEELEAALPPPQDPSMEDPWEDLRMEARVSRAV
jgi:hypothetical protein